MSYFKAHSRAEKNFKRRQAGCGSYYFVFIKYGNNEIIGTSKSYLNKSSMENSISLIKGSRTIVVFTQILWLTYKGKNLRFSHL
ncbi:YegP family protein [Algibacter sp. 2305UL17-15]|uniref:YegP family protein n=1 Tax=Algibacter sp. 2305UL17-15 TaxID=3231268 RepID=UPI00345A5100